MLQVISRQEVLETAAELEKSQYAFYDFVASANEGLRDTFAYLAAQEQRHELAFTDILRRFGGYSSMSVRPGARYLQIKELSDRCRTSICDRARDVLARGRISDSDAMDIAIGFEKDFILFYFEIHTLFPLTDRKTIQRIKRDELGHLKLLLSVQAGRLGPPAVRW